MTTIETRTVLARRPLAAYRTLDLVTTAMIGVTFGVAYLGWGYVYRLLGFTYALPPVQGLLVSPWFLAGALAGMVIRRPGAALAAEMMAASVEALLGGTWGVGTLASGALQGLGVELAFALFAYRRFGPAVLALGGVLAAVLESPYEWVYYWPDWSWSYKLLYSGFMAISTAVVLSLVTPVLTRALARAGVLTGFPPGQEHLRANAS